MSFTTLCSLAALADQVTLTILKITDTSFMAVIQPSLKLSEQHPQLASPLQVTAAPDQLGTEVAKAITSYKPVLEGAINNLSQIEAELQAAQKAARDKNKAKTTPSKPSTPAGTTTSASKPGSPMSKVTAPQAKPGPPDLFEGAPVPTEITDADHDDDGETQVDEHDDADSAVTSTPLMALGE